MKSRKLAGAGLASLLLYGCSVVEPTPHDLAIDVAHLQGIHASQVQIQNIQTSKKFVYFDTTTPTGRYSCTQPIGMSAFGTPPERRTICDPIVQ